MLKPKNEQSGRSGDNLDCCPNTLCIWSSSWLGCRRTTPVPRRRAGSPAQPFVAQIRKWTAEGLQVFCVQESCGFGFGLHCQLVAAGAQSFLITPIALNGQRKTDKLDARVLCLRLSRWPDGNRDELRPIGIPTEAEQRRRAGPRRRQFLGRVLRQLANRGPSPVAEYAHGKLPSRWWGASEVSPGPRAWARFPWPGSTGRCATGTASPTANRWGCCAAILLPSPTHGGRTATKDLDQGDHDERTRSQWKHGLLFDMDKRRL